MSAFWVFLMNTHQKILLRNILSLVFISFGGLKWIRTLDPLLAGQVLSQLSYTPISTGFPHRTGIQNWTTNSTRFCRDILSCKHTHSAFGFVHCLLRKEVIQPHLPIRLPCYDLTPIIEPTFGCSLLTVRTQTSGLPDFHGLTGGVYKARERIHRGMLIRDY